MQYEEAMHTAGVTSIDDALKDMASGDTPALEVNEYNMTLGRVKLYVTDITRPRLIRQVHACFRARSQRRFSLR